MTDAAHSSVALSGPSAPGARAGRWPAAALCAALGLALLALGVPRTIAAWSSMAGVEALTSLALGGKPSDAQIVDSIASLERALAWVPSGERYYILAGLEFEQYRRLGVTDPARAGLLARAEQHLTSALMASPSDGGASLLLATVRMSRGAALRDVAVPVLQAVDDMPSRREVWSWRSTLLLAVWPALTAEEASAMSAHLRAIWIADPKMRRQLVEAATVTGQQQVMGRALADEPGAVDEFERIRAQIAAGKGR